VFVALHVEEPVWDPIAGEEVTQPPRVRREVRADKPHTRAYPDQQRAPRDERAQDQITEPLVGADQLAQLLDAEHDHLAVLGSDGRDVGRLSAQQVRPAPEAALPDHGDQPLRRAPIVLVSRERPAQHDVELPGHLARAIDDLALYERAPLTCGIDHREQLTAEARKGLFMLELLLHRLSSRLGALETAVRQLLEELLLGLFLSAGNYDNVSHRPIIAHGEPSNP